MLVKFESNITLTDAAPPAKKDRDPPNAPTEEDVEDFNIDQCDGSKDVISNDNQLCSTPKGAP